MDDGPARRRGGSVDDQRRPPFCYQTHAALDVIRERFQGAKRTTAIAVYVGLTEAANRAGGEAAREGGFRAARRDLAEAVGISADTLDRYVSDLVQAGLVEVRRERVGSANVPNVWVLREGASAPPGRTGAATPGRTGAAVEQELELTPKENSVGPRVVNRIAVTDEERSLATAVLSSWNEQTDSRLGSSAWLGKIILRCREHPELDLDAHARTIRYALEHPWWTDAPTPSVVYGNAEQFERSLVAATQRGPLDDFSDVPDFDDG